MKEHHYFDNAATSWPKPECVYRYMDEFYRGYGVNPGRAGHEMAVEAERMITETRRLLGQFFNLTSASSHVVFTQNATDSLNTALFGLLNAGDHVISTRVEHNSVIRPLNHLERDYQVAVTRVEHDDQGYADPQDIRKALRPDTRVIVVNHASNVLGSIQDIEAIGKIAREAGVSFVVDSCQSAGVLPLDMEACNIDVLVFTGHKGLFGPMGIGGMLVREGVNIRPARVGGTGVDSITPFQPDNYPHRLEAGTVGLPGIAGLNAAQKWFAELGREQLANTNNDVGHAEACRAGLQCINAKEQAHIKQLEAAFRGIEKVKVYGPAGDRPRVATMSINIADLPADQIGTMLDADYGVCVRAGLHCAPLVHEDANTVPQKGTVRFSPGYFTDEEDMQQAILGVTELAEM
jgi:cysteine desulfurase/selenocysteine lyase